MKFNKPSKIQAASLPLIVAKPGTQRLNLIGQGHNGSGKTACFVLGMLSVIDENQSVPQALCVVPTREIARQIDGIVRVLGKFTKTRVLLAVPTDPKNTAGPRPFAAAISEQIVVGTAGKVYDLIKTRKLGISDIKMFVLDEADQMVATQGQGATTVRIKNSLPKDTQVVLFSATFPDEVRSLAEKIAPGANRIEVKREDLSLDRVKQFYIDCKSSENRYEVLSNIYSLLNLGQSVIFVGRVVEARRLTDRLRSEGHTVSVLHGTRDGMTIDQRDRVIDEFREGKTKVLVTTDVLSRGVDIMQVTGVINYDLPVRMDTGKSDPETYLHRVGRTGRFGRSGIAINFVYDEVSRALLKEISDYYQHKIEETSEEALEREMQALQ